MKTLDEMSFDDAYNELNTGDIEKVIAQMDDWHPSILGEMLKAVDAARQRRFPGYHPDYDDALVALRPAKAVRQIIRSGRVCCQLRCCGI